MIPTKIFEGTWDELSVIGPTLNGKRLRLTIVDDPVNIIPQEAEAARIAAIRAGMGKFADPARSFLASEELLRERGRDDRRLDQALEYRLKRFTFSTLEL